MRLMCAAAVSLSIGLLIAFADDKNGEQAGSRDERLAALQKKFGSEMEELKRRFAQATDASEKAGIREEARELAILSARDALKVAQEEPADQTALTALTFVVEQTCRYGGDECDKAIALLTDHHLDNPKLKDLLPSLWLAGPKGQKFLQALVQKTTNKEVKGPALFFLGVAAAKEIENEDDPKRVDGLINKATEYFEKAVKEAPDAAVGNATVKIAVTSELEILKALTALAIGKPAPEVQGTDLHGNNVKLSSYKGKVVLIDIWATWCGPCRSMIPHEREMVKRLKGKPFVLLSVSCDMDQQTLVSFLENEQMPWDHWFDGQQGPVAKTFRVRAFPSLFLIDHNGIIKNKWVGRPDNQKLEKAIDELVEEAERAK